MLIHFFQNYKNENFKCPNQPSNKHRPLCKFTQDKFHIAPDGKLYFTNIHNLKQDGGIKDFCIELIHQDGGK